MTILLRAAALMLLTLPAAVVAHPTRVACTTALEVGGATMHGGSPKVDPGGSTGSSQAIIVTRLSDQMTLAVGSNYVPGESLQLTLSPAVGVDWLWEVNVAGLLKCTLGADGYTRTDGDEGGSPVITAPSGCSDLVVKAAWSSSHSQLVYISTATFSATVDAAACGASADTTPLSNGGAVVAAWVGLMVLGASVALLFQT